MLSKEKHLAYTNGTGVSLEQGTSGKGVEEREEVMSSKERLMVIRQNIQNMKKVSVAELSRQCAVTEETIRRDLDKLEAEGVVTRIHSGGYMEFRGSERGNPFLQKTYQAYPGKTGYCEKDSRSFRRKEYDHCRFQYHCRRSVKAYS